MAKDEYDITTRRFNSGRIRTKYNVNGHPVRLADMNPKYIDVCQQITKSNKRIIETTGLEKLTALFEEI